MIIDDIVMKTRERLIQDKQRVPYDEMKAKALALPQDKSFPFRQALVKDGLAYILEVKKASPSKGLIQPDFEPARIAGEYEAIGADAVSVLTEPYYFQGKSEYVTQIHGAVALPILRKDFVIDDYMIYEAKVIGASAVLLITSILDDDTLKAYLELCHTLGLSALVEARDEGQVKRALHSGAKIIGVNNRDLRTFEVNMDQALKYRAMIPDDVIFVSESGIETRKDTQLLEDHHVNAVLIGETLMKAPDRQARLNELKGQL